MSCEEYVNMQPINYSPTNKEPIEENGEYYVEMKCSFCNYVTIWNSAMKFHIKENHENTSNELLEKKTEPVEEEIVVEPEFETVFINQHYEEEGDIYEDVDYLTWFYGSLHTCNNCDFQTQSYIEFNCHLIIHLCPSLIIAKDCKHQPLSKLDFIKHLVIHNKSGV